MQHKVNFDGTTRLNNCFWWVHFFFAFFSAVIFWLTSSSYHTVRFFFFFSAVDSCRFQVPGKRNPPREKRGVHHARYGERNLHLRFRRQGQSSVILIVRHIYALDQHLAQLEIYRVSSVFIILPETHRPAFLTKEFWPRVNYWVSFFSRPW